MTKLDPFAAAEILRKNREMTVVILRNLPEAAFTRTGVHNGTREDNAGEPQLGGYADHLEHHVGFIRPQAADDRQVTDI